MQTFKGQPGHQTVNHKARQAAQNSLIKAGLTPGSTLPFSLPEQQKQRKNELCDLSKGNHFSFFKLKMSKAGRSSEEIFTKTQKMKQRGKRLPV